MSLGYTPPKFDMENDGFQKGFLLFQGLLFRLHVEFRRCKWDDILHSYMGIIINNYYKDPYRNNQDSMESERFFFFLAHSVI